MNPELVAKRRSTVFHRIQLELFHSEVIKEKIQAGKFPASSVGIVKIIAIILLLSAAVSFISITTCPNTDGWYAWLLPLATCSGAAITIIFYAIFTLGLAVKFPDFWFVTDIAICIVFAIFIISTSVLTMTACISTKTMYQIPPPLGICGAIFLIFSAAGLYIMYRNKETAVTEVQSARAKPPPKRNRTLSTDVDV